MDKYNLIYFSLIIINLKYPIVFFSNKDIYLKIIRTIQLMEPKFLILLGFSFIIFNGMSPLSKKGMEIANTLWSLFFFITLAVIIESMLLRVIVTLIIIYGVFMYFVKNENIFNSDQNYIFNSSFIKNISAYVCCSIPIVIFSILFLNK